MAILSGEFSGFLLSGLGNWIPSSGIDCDQCGRNMGYIGNPKQTYVHVEHNPHLDWQSGLLAREQSNRTFVVCPECAGYLPEQQRFKTLEDYIRESLPSGLKDMPSLVLADYLEDHGASAAEWIRNHTSGG